MDAILFFSPFFLGDINFASVLLKIAVFDINTFETKQNDNFLIFLFATWCHRLFFQTNNSAARSISPSLKFEISKV